MQHDYNWLMASWYYKKNIVAVNKLNTCVIWQFFYAGSMLRCPTAGSTVTHRLTTQRRHQRRRRRRRSASAPLWPTPSRQSSSSTATRRIRLLRKDVSLKKPCRFLDDSAFNREAVKFKAVKFKGHYVDSSSVDGTSVDWTSVDSSSL